MTSVWPILIGHRGAMGHAPENTRAAFEAGLRLGADAVECDVHLSRDGRLVVIHDDTLDRTTNGSGPVIARTWPELGGLDAGSWFGRAFAGERLWRLEDLLRWAKGRRTRSARPLMVVVEIKNEPRQTTVIADRVVEEIRRAGMVNRAIVISFDHRTAARAKARCPRLRVGLLFKEKPADLARRMARTGAGWIFPRWTAVTGELIGEARRRGWRVGTWTVNAQAAMDRLREMGVDAMASNYPERGVCRGAR